MITVSWTILGVFEVAKGRLPSLWSVAHPLLSPGVTHLWFAATGACLPMPGLQECGPDGLMSQPFPEDRLVLGNCAVGALIGRIGGSSATLKAAPPSPDVGEGLPFPIGCHAVVRVPENAIGPLFLGVNILFGPVTLTAPLCVRIAAGVSAGGAAPVGKNPVSGQ
jgi:hypothetical protein